VFFGEVGLAGEVRAVSRPDARLAEAAKLGFTNAFAPRSAAGGKPPKGLRITGVGSLPEFLDALGL
jgi:DNA repair protein RadA/Sms